MSDKAHHSNGAAPTAAKTLTINNSTSAETKGRNSRILFGSILEAVNMPAQIVLGQTGGGKTTPQPAQGKRKSFVRPR